MLNAGPTSVWSVLQVPLLSTGDGSTVAGYGLGGARWSEVFEDLGESISMHPRGWWWWPSTHGVPHLFEKTCANGAGELGESV
jgi:hypothetical protein